MDFDEDGAITFEGGENDGAVGIGALSEECGGWVLNFFEAGSEHFEDSDFVGGAEAVFDGADGFEATIAIAFEIKDDVDEMFEDFGASESTILGNVTNNDDGGVGGLGGADDEIATIGDLGDCAWGGGDFVHGESLDGIDNDEVEIAGFDGLGDVVARGGGGETELVGVGAETNGTEFDLRSGFFAGYI